jgi:hypothetical protein
VRTVVVAMIAVFMAAGAIPSNAQNTLTSPVKPLDQPIEMAYRDLDTAIIEGSVSVTLSKQGRETHAQSHTIQGTTSASAVGSDLILYFNVGVDSGQPEESTCQMRRTGEVLKCSDDTKMTLPLYDRETYKSGDTVTMPFVTIDGVGRVLNGQIRGTSIIAKRQVLVVDFADKRVEKIKVKGASVPMDLTWEMEGYAYLDIATGYPVEMEASMEMVGPPTPDFDLARASMKLRYGFPETAN